MDLLEWTEEFSGKGWLWFVKRLSGNDTLANGSHQAGPYIPKLVAFRMFPSLETPLRKNPDKRFDVKIDSHPDIRNVRIVWYNTKVLQEGSRDEVRITNFGGAGSPLLDPDSTGALTVFAFHQCTDTDVDDCHIWVCRNTLEEDIIENITGPVEPGQWLVWPPAEGLLRMLAEAVRRDCWLLQEQIPPEWLEQFPTGEEIINKVIALRPDYAVSVDKRLMRRRECEFELFRSLEEAVEMPEIRRGFASIADFLEKAQSILQRRKARAGKSLELHVRQILMEEGFQEGRNFSWQPVAGNRPDFLFPNEEAYKDSSYPREKVRMLAVKTTLRDRWRQVTEECPDLPEKYLLTVQEGMSENQFRLIREAGIKLVVPEPLQVKYSQSIRPELLSVESFLAEIRIATG